MGGGPVAGHIMPVPWSMTNKATGAQALMVTYDPLAAAAAVFIEQYDAHVAACTATTDDTDVVEDDGGTFTNGQKQGRRLWACSNGTTKTEYLSGLAVLLKGARHYLFGSDDGCIKSSETVAGAACPASIIGPDPVHYPYTFFAPIHASEVDREFVTMYNGRVRVAAGKFKATCLKLLDQVAETGEPVVITKRGKALARLVPVRDEEQPRSIAGCMKGTILYIAPDEELLAPLGVRWNAAED